ncbi:MAG: RluA family pseudouridine synthase [Myxococcota bacterium]
MSPEEEDEELPLELIAGPEDEGSRLDRFLAAKVSGSSRSLIQKHIDEGAVLINEAPPKRSASTALRAGDRVTYLPPAPEPVELVAEDIPLDILYQDADIVVLNKQAGLVVHPAFGHPRGTLVNALLFHVKDLGGIGGELRPGIVHRLDRDTTGLMVVAKHDQSHRVLVDAFKARTVEKRYQAVVVGVPRPEAGTLDTFFGRHPTDRKRFSSKVKQGKRAITDYRVAARFGDAAARVEVDLKTGRTHQIRVHFADLGHPLVGDEAYGTRRTLAPKDARLKAAIEGFSRPALHAEMLAFDHPMSGARMRFVAPLPADLVALLAALEELK